MRCLFSTLVAASSLMALFAKPSFGAIPCDLQQELTRLLQGIDHRAERILPGRFGGQLVEISTRDPASYRFKDIYRTSLEFPPSIFINAIGDEKAAEVFGFSKLSDSPHKGKFFGEGGRYRIPNQAELQGAIDAINLKIPSSESTLKIPIRFYSAKGRLDPKVYLEKFAKHGELPIAEKGHYFIHDITAHAFAAFIPPELVQASRDQIQMLLNFESWLKIKHPELHAKIDFATFWSNEAQRVDFSNANFASRLGSPSTSRRHGSPHEVLKTFVAEGVSPGEMISDHVARVVYGQSLSIDKKVFLKPSEFRLAAMEFLNEIGGIQKSTRVPAFLMSPGHVQERIRFLRDKAHSLSTGE